jgi:hypothetical protein
MDRKYFVQSDEYSNSLTYVYVSLSKISSSDIGLTLASFHHGHCCVRQ